MHKDPSIWRTRETVRHRHLHNPGFDVRRLVIEAQLTLGITQLEMARMLGCSRRTVSRCAARRSAPGQSDLLALARAVHAKDPSLAAKLAHEGSQTLESLGLVKPAPAMPAVTVPAAHVRPFPPTRLVVESVVCAAAEVMQASPATVRGALRAAFARARGLGLTVEEMDDALTEPEEPKPATPRGKRG
jgi:transcriptional regulator with XRE-family HTH domain